MTEAPSPDNNEGREPEQLLDLSDIAPPRQKVKVREDGPIFVLASPEELGVRERARLSELQQQIAKLSKSKTLRESQAEQLVDLFRRVTRMVLREIDEDDLKALDEVEMEKLALVFTGRWVDYQRRLIQEAGAEEAMAILRGESDLLISES